MASCIPVLLSGGSGTRLWPLSRALYPKQLLSLIGDRSLLAGTAVRADAAVASAPIVIANAEHRFIIAEQLRSEGLEPQALVLEPVGRNTAAAVAAAALLAPKDAMLLVLPADHHIPDTEAFAGSVRAALAAAETGALVTFGITPDHPETGYGYIRRGEALPSLRSAYRLDRFVEKPDRPTAERYLEEGGWLWNSGMFVFPVHLLLQEMAEHAPEVLAATEKAVAKAGRDLDFLRLDAESFSEAPSISIDYAVMERTRRAVVVEAGFPWSDIGAWSALWELGEKDADGTVTLGDVLTHEVSGSYLRSEGPLVAAVGLSDAVVVATRDAVLVSDRERAQDVKAILEQLKAAGRTEATAHPIRYRPWGSYEILAEGPGVLVNRIRVKPGRALRLQRHQHRAEHWVVVKGRARVTRGEDLITLGADQSTFIPAGMVHTVSNPGPDELLLIEVQSGSIVGEDDIERI